jgi:hypothetical protein
MDRAAKRLAKLTVLTSCFGLIGISVFARVQYE